MGFNWIWYHERSFFVYVGTNFRKMNKKISLFINSLSLNSLLSFDIHNFKIIFDLQSTYLALLVAFCLKLTISTAASGIKGITLSTFLTYYKPVIFWILYCLIFSFLFNPSNIWSLINLSSFNLSTFNSFYESPLIMKFSMSLIQASKYTW